jgi:hypothetical protein
VKSYYHGTEGWLFRCIYPRGENNIKAILNEESVLKEMKAQREHVDNLTNREKNKDSPINLDTATKTKRARLHFSQISLSHAMV